MQYIEEYDMPAQDADRSGLLQELRHPAVRATTQWLFREEAAEAAR
jgi:hypothetical protein